MRRLSLRLVCLAIAVCAASACGGPPPREPDRTILRCEVAHAATPVCSEYVRPLSDTMRVSLIVKCREVDGVIVDACKDEHLVGVCERAEDRSKPWTMNEVTRVRYYMPPDAYDAARVEQIAARCPSWTPAPLQP